MLTKKQKRERNYEKGSGKNGGSTFTNVAGQQPTEKVLFK